jgi:putative ABC transport system substrate-binding protein
MQFDRLRRRKFLGVLGGAAAWPLAARAQPDGRIRRVGILMTVQQSDPATQGWLAAFQRRLMELGWVEDRNVRFDRRWADGDPERMRANIAEIVGTMVDVVLAQNTPTVALLRTQTDKLPIVFVQVSDPIGDGFVESLARPGGNTTGFTNSMESLGGKWVELLKEAAPGVSQVGYLFNRAAAPGGGEYYMASLLKAAAVLGVRAVPLELREPGEIEKIIAEFAGAGGNGLIGNSDSFITVNRDRIISTADSLRLPTMFPGVAFARSGGLISYGPDIEQQWQGAASYVDRVLRGEKPSNLPVQQPTKFIMTINMKTATAIGLDVPWQLQQLADEVIE